MIVGNERIIGFFSFPRVHPSNGEASFLMFYVEEGAEVTVGMKMVEVMCELARAAGATSLTIPASIGADDEAMLSLWRSKNPDIDFEQQVLVRLQQEDEDDNDDDDDHGELEGMMEGTASCSPPRKRSSRQERKYKEKLERQQKIKWLSHNFADVLEVSGSEHKTRRGVGAWQPEGHLSFTSLSSFVRSVLTCPNKGEVPEQVIGWSACYPCGCDCGGLFSGCYIRPSDL